MAPSNVSLNLFLMARYGYALKKSSACGEAIARRANFMQSQMTLRSAQHSCGRPFAIQAFYLPV